MEIYLPPNGQRSELTITQALAVKIKAFSTSLTANTYKQLKPIDFIAAIHKNRSGVYQSFKALAKAGAILPGTTTIADATVLEAICNGTPLRYFT